MGTGGLQNPRSGPTRTEAPSSRPSMIANAEQSTKSEESTRGPQIDHYRSWLLITGRASFPPKVQKIDFIHKTMLVTNSLLQMHLASKKQRETDAFHQTALERTVNMERRDGEKKRHPEGRANVLVPKYLVPISQWTPPIAFDRTLSFSRLCSLPDRRWSRTHQEHGLP